MSEPDDISAGQASGEELIAAACMLMPFGRFEGTRLIDLPEPYLVWFYREGFPRGRLGERLALMHEIKVNGLEKLVRPLLDTPHLDRGNSPG
jgi:uncharacterized protein (DUF3820 family)